MVAACPGNVQKASSREKGNRFQTGAAARKRPGMKPSLPPAFAFFARTESLAGSVPVRAGDGRQTRRPRDDRRGPPAQGQTFNPKLPNL